MYDILFTVTISLVSITFFFLGRYTATQADIQKIKEIIKKIKKGEIGSIKRPTSDDLFRQTPKGKRLTEEEEEMEKVLEKTL